MARAFIETSGTPGIGLLNFSALVLVVLLGAGLPDRYGSVVLGAFASFSLLVVALAPTGASHRSDQPGERDVI